MDTFEKRKKGEIKMKKAIYKNPKSGKFYTFDKKEGEEKGEILPVFINNEETYKNSETKSDINGKAFKTVEARKIMLKNGFAAYVVD